MKRKSDFSLQPKTYIGCVIVNVKEQIPHCKFKNTNAYLLNVVGGLCLDL